MEDTLILDSPKLRIRTTPLEGLLVFEPKVFRDDRGFFVETFREEHLASAGIHAPFVQDNQSRSARGTIRALHFQVPPGQAKLVRCARGSVWDVAVDLRKSSATFGKWFGLELSDRNHHQLFVPAGFAHGFCVTSDEADVAYRCSAYYDETVERGIAWDSCGIDWPTDSPLLSDRDRSNPAFEDYSGPWFP